MDSEAIQDIDRQQLIALAYRMTGEVAASEDIVQDLVENWLTHPRQDVHKVGAYLAKAVTNRCLNYLTSVKRQREHYKGVWLPEPLVTEPFKNVDTSIDLSFGFMLLLAKLTPTERAVFLLKESFDLEYSELADLLSLSQANCRQLYHRAQTHLVDSKKRFPVSYSQQQALLSAFNSAVETGDVSDFIKLLNQDIILFADGGGKEPTPLRPLLGIQTVASFLRGITKKMSLSYSVKSIQLNGNESFLVFTNDPSQINTMICFEMNEDKVETMYLVRNPDKLRHVTSFL